MCIRDRRGVPGNMEGVPGNMTGGPRENSGGPREHGGYPREHGHSAADVEPYFCYCRLSVRAPEQENQARIEKVIQLEL